MFNLFNPIVVHLAKYQAFLGITLLIIGSSPIHADTLRVPGNYKTIQSAINAAEAGDTVLLNAGTYKERIRLKPGIILRSAGNNAKGILGLKRAEATIIDGGGKDGQGPGVIMAEGATLDGITVTNVGLYDDVMWNKHHATQGRDQTHEHIGKPGNPGIEVTGVTCHVTNNIVHHIGYTGIAITGVIGKQTSPLIQRNICYRNMGGGIGSMKQSDAVIKENICFQNFYAGIGHNHSSPFVLNNICYENIRAGIGISEGSKPVVRGNKCYLNRRAGIGIRTGADTQPIIEDNDCYENDMAGIGNRDDAQPIIRNNRCYRNKMAGIGSRNGARPIIVGNDCFENDMAGIAQRNNAQTIIVRNHSHHNKMSGIGFEDNQKGKATVVDNRIVDNMSVAVGIHGGWNVHFINNLMSREGGLPPIAMVFSGATVNFIDNTIKGSGVAGIRVAGSINAINNRFVGMELRKNGPPNYAVWGLAGSEITFNNNMVNGWRHAIVVDKSAITAWNNTISNYWQFGIKINDPSTPANVFNNVLHSELNHPAVSIKGTSGYIDSNHIVNDKK